MADNSDSAFPSLAKSWRDSRDDSMVHETVGGMSLRDYFAAKALQGFCANPAIFAANGRTGWSLVNATEPQIADYCLVIADAMLAERAK